MHRRARHLTGRAAGASYHYDARRVNSTNGSTLGTIYDLAGSNNLTQSTVADQAIYIANGLNGNPVIRFDGSTDFYSLASTVPIQGEYFGLLVYKTTSQIAPTFTNRLSATATPYTNFYYNGTLFSTYGNGSINTPGMSSIVNVFNIISTYTNGNYQNGRHYTNGSLIGGVTYSSPASTESGSMDTFGRRDWDTPDVFFAGDLACGIHIRGTLASSLKKRFEHACGFSFKIACS